MMKCVVTNTTQESFFLEKCANLDSGKIASVLIKSQNTV